MNLEDKYLEIYDKIKGGEPLSEEESLRRATEDYINFEKELDAQINMTYRSHLEDLKHQLKEEEKLFISKRKEEENSKSKSKSTIMAVVSLIGIMILSYFLFFKANQSTDKLFDQYYEKYPALAYNRSVGEADNDISIAYKYYSNNEFELSVEKFKNITGNEARFYEGLCQLELKKYKEAIALWSSISAFDKTLPFEYYYGLALIANNEKAKAKAQLQKVPTKPEYYYNKAQELLNIIK